MKRKHAARLVMLLAGAVSAAGSATAAPPAKAPQTAPAAAAPAVPTEYLDAGKAIESAVMTGDAAALADYIDFPAMLEAATKGVSASKEFHDGFVSGASRTNTVVDGLASLGKSGASYRVLHARIQNGKPHLMFRMFLGGINYHDWILEKEKDGKIRAVDINIAATGEPMTASLHRLYVTGAAQADAGLLDRLLGADRSMVDHGADVQALTQASRDKDYARAIRIYNSLPESLQHEKSLALIDLVCLDGLRTERPAEYAKAIDAYVTRFPGDPSANILCLDGWLAGKQYDKCYKALNALNTWCGGDPIVGMLRANILMLEGKPGAAAEAEKLTRDAIAGEGRLLAPRSSLVQALALEAKYDDAVDALRDFETMAHGKMNVEGTPALKDFAASDAYKKYRAIEPKQNP